MVAQGKPGQTELERLRASEAEWRTLIETMPQIVWITRPDGHHVHFNHKWMDFTGLTLQESLGFGWNPPFHPDDRSRAAARWEQATSSGEPYEIEYRLRRADGVYHWMLGRAMPLRDESGVIVKWFGTCTDIEELKQAQARAAEQAQLLDQTQDAVLVLDLDGCVTSWNRAAERVHGWTAQEAVGRRVQELICPDLAQVESAMAGLLTTGEWTGDLRLVHRDGNAVLVEGRWTLLRHPGGAPRAVLAVGTDVTVRRRIESQFLEMLELKATHDALTGLPNRSLLFDRLDLLLRQRDGAGVAVAFLDLNGFKTINDELGHQAGDDVLKVVAERLSGGTRRGDVAARIGGDEFVVVGQAVDEDAARRLGERLLTAVSGPADVGGRVVEIAASVGVAFVRPQDDETADDALSRADALMYAAKRRSRESAAG